MATIIAPTDGRPQYSFGVMAMANASLGRMPWAGMQQVGPNAYVVANSWLPPKAANDFSSAVAATAPEPAAPSPAARLWPNLSGAG